MPATRRLPPAARDTRTRPAPERLSFVLNVRFTQAQGAMLERIAAEANRPTSAIVRDVVTIWALNHRREAGEDIDLAAAVLELQHLGDAE